MPIFQIKRGDSYVVEATVTENAVAKDMTGWTLRSQVRRGNTLVAALTVTWVNQVGGIYRLEAVGGTENWPVDLLRQDIEYTSPAGQIASTETFEFECIEDVTR